MNICNINKWWDWYFFFYVFVLNKLWDKFFLKIIKIICVMIDYEKLINKKEFIYNVGYIIN